MNIKDLIKRGESDLPHRIVLAGPCGIGKSTFASKAPNPLFISAEDGLTSLEHVQRYTPSSMEELYAFLDALIVDNLGFKTLVIDTADWLERTLTTGICKRDNQKNIEDYGYGKGHTVLEIEVVKVLQKLDELRLKKKMGVILLAHVTIAPHPDPRGFEWKRYELKCTKKVAGLLREWPDAVFFAFNEIFTTKAKDGKERVIGGDRVLYTSPTQAYDAKNRLNLPESVPFDWEPFAQAVKENSTTALRERVGSLFKTAKLEAAEKVKWEKWMATVNGQSPDRIKAAIEKLSAIQ